MATQITQRANIVCTGLIAQNGVRYTVLSVIFPWHHIRSAYPPRTKGPTP